MLYPPIVKSYMPAFDKTKGVRIYFSISTYNSISDIAQVQMAVRYQVNNRNALNTTTYPNGIICCPSVEEVQPDEDPTIASTAARYYVTLSSSDLLEPFEAGVLYKVQLRFSSRSWDSKSSAANLASTSSEWSTVCLLKPIDIPKFRISLLDSGDDEDITSDEEVSIVYSSIESTFTGVYEPATASLTLRYWRMRLYDQSGDTLLADSGIQTVNAYDSIDNQNTCYAQLKYIMSNNTSYHLVFDIETKNGYTASKTYAFTSMAFASGSINGTLTLEINEEDGYAKVTLAGNGEIVHTNVTLRRTSSLSNFTIWEDIANKTFENSTMDWEFDDFTIESGIFYQYSAQTRDNRGRRSASIRTTQEMGLFLDAFLTEKGGSLDDALQLKIRFNMAIANTMVNVGEAKTDTIGSQYPFVRRNGNMYYHSFPVSFLIASEEDNNNLFATETELRDNQTDLYRVAYGSNTLTVESGRYDYTYQRKFREKVEAFLYNAKVKLFRSGTLGNMLVKLMNITMTPNADLSRMLYSVDATAVEIDAPTLENIDKYGIQLIGTYNTNITFDEVKIGQLNTYSTEVNAAGDVTTIEGTWPANFNLMGDSSVEGAYPTIKNMFHWGESINDVIVDDLYLSYLRILINSDPYLIKNEGGVLSPLDDTNDREAIDDNTLLGTLINICGTTILIEYPNTIYEMKGENIRITSSQNITPLKATKMVVDFVANLSESNDTSRIATTLIYRSLNGQLVGPFRSGADLYTQIYQKYYLDLYGSKAVEKPYYTRVQVVYNINIEADPGVVLYVETSGSEKPRRVVIDESGLLFIDPGEDTGYITELYFYGRTIEKAELEYAAERRKKLPNFTEPRNLDSYTDDAGTHIFIDGAWYIGTAADNGNSYDIRCNVPALVNYYIQVVKGIY